MTTDTTALLAEFRERNAKRTPGPITPENDNIQLQAMCPAGYVVVEGRGKPSAEYWERNTEAEGNLLFYAWCGTHAASLIDSQAAEIERQAQRIAELEAELATYQSNLIAEHESTVRNDGRFYEDGKNAGWYSSNALSHVCDAGDWLVAAGLWEIKPDGYGRAQFYRPLLAAVKDGTAHV